VEDRNQPYVGIGIHSYEPNGSKGKNPIRILSSKISMKSLQTKGGLSFRPHFSKRKKKKALTHKNKKEQSPGGRFHMN